MEGDHQDLINQFSEICGTDLIQSQFYLEAANFDLDIAVSSFFAEQEESPNPASHQELPLQESSQTIPQISTHNSEFMANPTDRIATIASLGRRGSSGSDDSGDEGHQAFYVGGSEQGGGQEVLGPKKKGGAAGSSDIIKGVFQAARDHGAEEVAMGAGVGPSNSKPKRNLFAGSGYRLGENPTEDSVLVGDPSSHTGGAGASEAPQQMDMVLKMWQNGFSVDDGPLREYNDPTNREFLATISRGEVPQEILRLARGGEVNLNMEDHRTEEYKQPTKPKAKPFQGAGHVLGSPAPTIVTSSTSSSTAVASVHVEPVSSIEIDEVAPVTQIQIRLGDGTRLIAKFNHTHTVSDIRQHILSLRPEFGARTFILMTTFPNREIKDESQTLANEKLLNAVIVQKFA